MINGLLNYLGIQSFMNINNIIILFTITILTMGCAKTPNNFEMTVERVDKLGGFVLKGISISGTVAVGCIASDAVFNVKRSDEQVLEHTAKILTVSKNGKNKPPNGEAIKGEYATFYIPDGSEDDVKVGDIISSSVISCKKTSLVRLAPKK